MSEKDPRGIGRAIDAARALKAVEGLPEDLHGLIHYVADMTLLGAMLAMDVERASNRLECSEDQAWRTIGAALNSWSERATV